MNDAVIKRIQIPDDLARYTYGDQCDLESWDIESAHKAIPGMTHAWYWYSNGGYEGIGYFLALSRVNAYDTMWSVLSLDHCSCYGPFDPGSRYYWRSDGHHLEGIAAMGTREWWDKVRPLVDAAKEDGHA